MDEATYFSEKLSREQHHFDLRQEYQIYILVQIAEMNLFSMLKPKVSKEGDKYMVLYGENIQEGICGFGDSPYLAILDFNAAMHRTINPY